jgi:hypothetical protein
VDRTWIYEWPAESFGPEWKPLDEFDTIQQVDLLPKLFHVAEHRARRYLHRPTGKVIAASLPDEVVRAGLVGPRLSALVAYQKGGCHMSYRVIATFVQDVLGLRLSTGQLAKVVGKASAALAPGYGQLQAALPGRAMLNIDETGHARKRQAALVVGPARARSGWFYVVPHRPGAKFRCAQAVARRIVCRRRWLRLPQCVS